ncbi:MAG: hypothetical protein ACFFBH_15360 [Promethearchaeota archaeon]
MSFDEKWDEKKENEKEDKSKDDKDAGKVIWELHNLRDELMFELDELHDDLKEAIEDIKDEAEDVKDDLRDELEDLMSEREELLEEVGDIKGELEQYGESARDRIEHAKEKLKKLREKLDIHEDKFNQKVKKKVEKAAKKAARINISVDPDVSDEWRDWAEGLGASVSELVRKSMKFVKNNIGDIGKLEKLGPILEEAFEGSGINELGDRIEEAVKKSGIEGIGKEMDKKFKSKQHGTRIKIDISEQSDKERAKKRIQGLIKLKNSIPIEKLAQVLNIPQEEAENMIYELAAEGIEGTLQEGVFQFEGDSERVITVLFKLIDKL